MVSLGTRSVRHLRSAGKRSALVCIRSPKEYHLYIESYLKKGWNTMPEQSSLVKRGYFYINDKSVVQFGEEDDGEINNLEK